VGKYVGGADGNQSAAKKSISTAFYPKNTPIK
jgi:hypothetical protein